VSQLLASLTGKQQKKANVLRGEIGDMAEKYSVPELLTITFTFANPYPDREEAQRRKHSFDTNVIRKNFECGVWVFERSTKGRPHYHEVVAAPDKDFLQGWDWDAYKTTQDLNHEMYRVGKRKDLMTAYRAAQRKLMKGASDDFKDAVEMCKHERAKGYGLGMIHLAPVKNEKAVAYYWAKYILKDGQKDGRDKGYRDYGIWGKRRKVMANHSLIDGNAYKWRMKCECAAHYMRLPVGHDFTDLVGPRWAFHIGDEIADIPWEYVRAWLTHGEDLEHPEVQKWSWVQDGMKALGRVEAKFVSLYRDGKGDTPLAKPEQTPSALTASEQKEFVNLLLV